MSRQGTTRVATCNMFNGLPIADAEVGLRSVLQVPDGKQTDIIGLQEWGGAARNNLLRSKFGQLSILPQARKWTPLPNVARPVPGYFWARSLLGGGPIGFNSNRFELRFVLARVLVGPGRVDVAKGYRTNLGPSWATVATAFDNLIEDHVTVINFHLTTHVEAGGKYRPECPLRALRHQKERAALTALAGYHLGTGRRVYVTGDTNFHRMPLPPLVSAFDVLPAKPTGGTLGTRRIDEVYGKHAPVGVQEVESESDHDHIVADFDDEILPQ